MKEININFDRSELNLKEILSWSDKVKRFMIKWKNLKQKVQVF